MVTLPSRPRSAPPHAYRKIARSFGDDAERYDRCRPRYPDAMRDTILEGLPGPDLLDVGIGTGISALPFRDAGCTVLGVEPDTRMAMVARSGGFDVEVAAFEDWDPAGRRFDGIISGQTWHWIDPAVGAEKAAATLRPAGRLAAFWNLGDPPRDIALAFGDLYRRLETGLPFTPWAVPAIDAYRPILAAGANGIRASRSFTEPEEWHFEWTTYVSRDDWLEFVPTAGGHAQMAPEALERLLSGMSEVIDEQGGQFLMSYTTVVLAATRL